MVPRRTHGAEGARERAHQQQLVERLERRRDCEQRARERVFIIVGLFVEVRELRGVDRALLEFRTRLR